MVVFQYGSIVLFNVSDLEADGYLNIVEKHASGLLPEMRKDGKAFSSFHATKLVLKSNRVSLLHLVLVFQYFPCVSAILKINNNKTILESGYLLMIIVHHKMCYYSKWNISHD
jgi:uncharacterized Rmd1/YagE family protein